MLLRLKTLPVLAVFACLMAAWLPTHANAVPLVTWTITGDGVTSETQVATNIFDLDYDLVRNDFVGRTWQVMATAPDDGDYVFDWMYTGYHGEVQSTAFLVVIDPNAGPSFLLNVGPEDGGTPPSGGFSYTGDYTFMGLTTGQSFGFNVGGGNLDVANNVLNGTLTLTQVPEPGTLAILGFAFAAIGLARRRAKTGSR